MPRTRATETAQRQSPRGPPSLRTSSSDSDPPHPRPRAERNSKLSDGRSPRDTQSHPLLNQRKLGTRIADLESQLGLAQEELKTLKDQLVSTEAPNKAAQDQLGKKPKKQQKVLEIEEKHSTPIEAQTLIEKDGTLPYEESYDIDQETDVFEVPIDDQKLTVEPKAEVELPVDEEDEVITKSISMSNELPAISESENPLSHELALKNDEISLLNRNLDEKEKELEAFRQENEILKSQLDEESQKMSSAQSKIDELTVKLSNVNEELEKSRSSGTQMNEKLEAAEKAKEELEEEMRRVRVQTEQWRKAADAAASVLEMNGRRISERCGSMDKLYGGSFNHVGGYDGYVCSNGMIEDNDDVFGGEKRKGIRMFGDLWKKKGQK